VEGIVIIVRRLIAIALIAGSAYAFYLFCVLPYRCNRIKKAGAVSTVYAYEHGGSPEGSLRARQNLARLSECMGPTCRDITTDMIAAANYRVLGRYDDAIRLYHHALQLNHRPELYANLASTEAAAGDRNAARRDLLRAALFSPGALRSVDDGLLRMEVIQQLIALRPENAQYIREVATVP
jgi:tetratricopeptide (TPR) repeat protein